MAPPCVFNSKRSMTDRCSVNCWIHELLPHPLKSLTNVSTTSFCYEIKNMSGANNLSIIEEGNVEKIAYFAQFYKPVYFLKNKEITGTSEHFIFLNRNIINSITFVNSILGRIIF